MKRISMHKTEWTDDVRYYCLAKWLNFHLLIQWTITNYNMVPLEELI
jgi:hypothetical protein